MRAILAWLKMRVDFPLNGCWLPHNTAAKPHMPGHLSLAVPHSRIHRNGYYMWLGSLLDQSRIDSEHTLKKVLRDIKHKLQTSTFPEYVMYKAEQLR